MTETPDATSPRDAEASSSRLQLGLSALVTATVVVAVLWVGRHQARLRQSDEELSLAFVACQNGLEALRQLPFERLAGVDGSGFDVLGSDGAPGGLRPLDNDPNGLPGQLAVRVDKHAGSDVLYRVTATVSWRGALRDQVFALETLMGARQ